MHKLFGIGTSLLLFFAVAPNSTNYTLQNYNVGNGGSGTGSSSNYQVNGVAGQQSGTTTTSATTKESSGVIGAETSNVPPAPAFTNPANYYDKLNIVINTGSNATDTKFQIAISSDSFVTTQYVQADNSIGNGSAITTYQTYAAWGGATGINITGLLPATTYQVKVRALQGKFTGSAFGPIATAATVSPSLTYSLVTSLTSSPPFPVGFPALTPGLVIDSSADAIVNVTSNANSGGSVYLRSLNAGLTSTSSSTTIASASTDLTSATTGYGAIVTALTQTSGGPFTSVAPYNGTTNNVGALNTALQPIFTTLAPVTGGTGTVRLKAKSSNTTPAATDYSDTITFVIAMTY